ncbi:hypothetical protein C7M84_021667 [Penaeus vannamei]|uniref:Uncharacterized protein n=1 Tax=Penaeus vannamei TaxID=6689 RepID=A0A3R7PF89_PENVA|nr:hypothetical protein C7M84_021667 [Penaeus vannamei]
MGAVVVEAPAGGGGEGGGKRGAVSAVWQSATDNQLTSPWHQSCLITTYLSQHRPCSTDNHLPLTYLTPTTSPRPTYLTPTCQALDRPSPPAKPSTVPSPRQSRLSLDTYLTPTPAKPSTRCQALDSAYLTNSTVPCQALDLPTTCQPTTCQALDSVPNTNKPRQCYLCQALDTLDSTYLTPTTCQALDSAYLTPTTCQALDSAYLTPTTCQALDSANTKPASPANHLPSPRQYVPNTNHLPSPRQYVPNTNHLPSLDSATCLDTNHLKTAPAKPSTVRQPPAKPSTVLSHLPSATQHQPPVPTVPSPRHDQLSLAVTKSNGSDAERDAIIAPAFRQTCNRQKETACTQNIFPAIHSILYIRRPLPYNFPEDSSHSPHAPNLSHLPATETRRRSNEQGIIFARRPRRCDLSRVASSVPQPPELSPGGQDSQVIPQPGKNPGRHSKIISQRQHPENVASTTIPSTPLPPPHFYLRPRPCTSTHGLHEPRSSNSSPSASSLSLLVRKLFLKF